MIGVNLHVVGRRHHRPAALPEAAFDVAQARLGLGVQQVPAVCLDAVTAQLIEAGHAPDIRCDAEIFLQQFSRGNHFAQNRSAAQELHFRHFLVDLGFAEKIHTLEYPCFRALRHRRVCVVFVHHRDVIKHVLLLPVHAAQPVLHNHSKFISKSRVVGNTVGNGGSNQMAVSVLVLQTFAVERGAAGSAPEQEAARAGIACRPGEVADALETEHRIENVERNHRNAVRAVGGSGGDPRRHATSFADALLQNLPVFVFLVEHQLVGVLGCVELPHRGPDAQLPEHALHAESA